MFHPLWILATPVGQRSIAMLNGSGIDANTHSRITSAKNFNVSRNVPM